MKTCYPARYFFFPLLYHVEESAPPNLFCGLSPKFTYTTHMHRIEAGNEYCTHPGDIVVVHKFKVLVSIAHKIQIL